MRTGRALDTKEARVQLADEIDRALWHHTVDAWFPRCIDSSGGYWSNFDARWNRLPEDRSRTVVFQSRMLWVTSTAAQRSIGRAQSLQAWADHGFDYLRDTFWKPDEAGLLFAADCPGRSHTYGVAFAVSGLVAYHRSSGKPEALNLAQQIFDRWEMWAFDGEPGGVVEVLSSAAGESPNDPRWDEIGTPSGLRSSNALLHVVSALTRLASVGDDRVRARLAEVVVLLESLVEAGDGQLFATYRPDGTAADSVRSPGHDLEVVVFLLAARRELGLAAETTSEVLAEWVLDNAIDRRNGGVFSHMDVSRRWRWDTTKVWWVQVEAMAAFAALAARGGPRAGDYLEALAGTWDFVRSHQIDVAGVGWYGSVDRRGKLLESVKGQPWKSAYHETSALLRTSDWLRRM